MDRARLSRAVSRVRFIPEITSISDLAISCQPPRRGWPKSSKTSRSASRSLQLSQTSSSLTDGRFWHTKRPPRIAHAHDWTFTKVRIQTAEAHGIEAHLSRRHCGRAMTHDAVCDELENYISLSAQWMLRTSLAHFPTIRKQVPGIRTISRNPFARFNVRPGLTFSE